MQKKRESRALSERKCLVCGKVYKNVFWAKDWFCSPRCKVKGRMVIDKKTGCWLSTLAPSPDGYVRIQMGGRREGNRRKVLLHRYSFEAFKRKIPEGLLCLHSCDRPNCLRPSHLFLGTNTDNMQDASKKGRLLGAKGKNLRPADVREIRKLILELPIHEVAAMFKVTRRTIHHILSGRTWSHVK